MKIPVTDKFLLELYEVIERCGNLANLFMPGIPSLSSAINPEYRRLIQKYSNRKSARNFNQLVYYLKRYGYIRSYNLKNHKGIIITSKGLGKILKTKFKTIEKKKRDDKKWQMIIFDVPERKRTLRSMLRENLIFLGFRMLQQSVWVTPFDVLEETEKFIQRNNLDKYVKMFLIEEF